MKIPQSQHLHNQTFNSEFIEFVWQFNDCKQFIFQIRKDSSAYIEAGKINDVGDYVDGSHWLELSPNVTTINDVNLWNDSKYNFVDYNFFSNGKELVSLVSDVVKYLNEA